MDIKNCEQKILLVDDDAKNLQVAMSILKDYSVIYAQSGKKALELVSEHDFDLILLDVVMPSIDGYEVCRSLKQNDKTKEIPIIFLTVKDDERDILRGFEFGAVDYITKPFYPAVLLKRVDSHLLLSKSLKDLKKLNSELIDKVDVQVEVIREKDKLLFNQTKMAALSEMVDTISNRLKYPLGLIRLQSQALELKAFSSHITSSEISDTTMEIINQINDLEHNIDDFKQFFSETKTKQNFNLHVLIDSIILSLRDTLIRKKINFSINGDISIDVDFATEELRYIFTKFIKNSIYAFSLISKDEKRIEFNIIEDHHFVYVTYKDNAGGIILESLETIFDSSYTTKKNGSGIGLYLSRLFVEKNDGEISVENVDEGVLFTIKFPKIILCENIESSSDLEFMKKMSLYK